ncbi:MAG: hypothetical protein APF80_03665 [Alphaproteobacteria bacterium BRH_c36]|nr:MAG: hypothetical protein APF80_03665 [Alphaproteobacteria bacterium BRH_c36]
MNLSNRPEDFPGYFATILWVGVGVWLFWTTPGGAFLSWQALVYFIFGTLAVGIVFGVVGMSVQRLIPMLKPRQGAIKTAAPPAQIVGTLVAAAQFVVIYFLAKAVVTGVLFPPAPI